MSLVKSEIEENNELVNNLIYPTENRTITQRIVKKSEKVRYFFYELNLFNQKMKEKV